MGFNRSLIRPVGRPILNERYGLVSSVMICSGRTGMELNAQVAGYVVCFYRHFMTDVEQKALNHLIATRKATHGRSDKAAQCEAQKHIVYSRALSSEPDVLRLARNGHQEFELRTAARILRDFGDKVFFNYCPNCGELARTPTAKQCWHCRHDWHAR